MINVSRCLLCDILYVAASSRTSPMFSDNACICFALVLFRSCVKDGFCEPVVTYVLMLVNTTSTQQPNCLASFLNIENGQKISRSDIEHIRIVSSFYNTSKGNLPHIKPEQNHSCHSIVYFMNTITNFAVHKPLRCRFSNDARRYEFTRIKLYQQDSEVRNTHLSSNRWDPTITHNLESVTRSVARI